MDQNLNLIRKGIINTLAASGGNVKNDAAVAPDYPGSCILCELNSVVPPVEILPPIFKDKVIKATYLSSQAEIRQRAFIGRLAETVVAAELYRIEIGNSEEKYETMKASIGRYGYKAPATLSGVAGTDRSLMYAALNTKINNDNNNNVTSYLVSAVAFTTGATALPQIGEVFTQATSGATGVLVGIDITSGDFTTGNAAGTVYLCAISGTWSASSLVSTGGTSTGVFTSAALLTANIGLNIVDDAGYHSARPYLRKGINTVLLTKGFATATVEIGIATAIVGTTGILAGLNGIYSRGIGSRMAQDVPGWTPDKVYVTEGEAGFILNAAPDAAKVYRTWHVFVNTDPVMDLLTAFTKGHYVIYEFFTDESNSTNTGTFKSALDTALGVTATGA